MYLPVEEMHGSGKKNIMKMPLLNLSRGVMSAAVMTVALMPVPFSANAQNIAEDIFAGDIGF